MWCRGVAAIRPKEPLRHLRWFDMLIVTAILFGQFAYRSTQLYIASLMPDELCERYFLKYNVSVNEFTQIIEESEFQSLPLDKQKQMVLEMLDLNQMYVSLSEMDDEQFAGCLNDDDKALSRAFYQAEKKDGE